MSRMIGLWHRISHNYGLAKSRFRGVAVFVTFKTAGCRRIIHVSTETLVTERDIVTHLGGTEVQQDTQTRLKPFLCPPF